MVSLTLRGQGDQIGRSLPYLKKVIYQITLKRLSRIFDSQETSGGGGDFILVYNKDSVVFLYKCTCFANLLRDTEVRCCNVWETPCSDNLKTHPRKDKKRKNKKERQELGLRPPHPVCGFLLCDS